MGLDMMMDEYDSLNGHEWLNEMNWDESVYSPKVYCHFIMQIRISSLDIYSYFPNQF